MKYFYKPACRSGRFSILLAAVLLITNNLYSQWFVQTSGTNANLYSVCFTDVNTGTVAGSQGTILRTTDGGVNWNAQTSNSSQELYHVCFIDADNGTVVGSEGTIIRTTDGGSSWINQSSGTNYTLYAVSFSDINTGTAVGSEGTIRRTTNGGQNWESQTSNTYYPLYDVCFTDNNHGVIVGGSLTILRTTDGGEYWIDESLRAPHELLAVSFSDANNGTAVGYYDAILRTTDGGMNWSSGTSGMNNWWHGVSFTDENTGTVVSDLGMIIRTTDGGENWVQQECPPYTWLEDVCFTDAYTGTAVGESGLILRTTNGGLPVEFFSFTAEIINDGVILKWQTASEINNKGYEVERKVSSRQYAVGNGWEEIGFVNGNGTTTEPKSYSYTDNFLLPIVYIYRLKQIDFDGTVNYSPEVKVEISDSMEFALYQNYPNPFNPRTIINYQLPTDGHITLKIYNALGEEMETLVNQYKPAGKYEAEFDGSKYAGGVYFCRLKAGDLTEIKKMVLLK